jgi:hypothetical protein
MTPARTLHRAVTKLPESTPLADRWPVPKHSDSHKEHWQGWLWQYDGPGYYNRRIPKTPRSMAYIFGHVHCSPMLLWLAEAAGVDKRLVREADRVMRRLVDAGLSDSNPKTANAFRKIIGWSLVEAALTKRGLCS